MQLIVPRTGYSIETSQVSIELIAVSAILEKGRSHKYVKREMNASPPPKWRYWYYLPGKGIVTSSSLHTGAKFKDKHTQHGGHWQVTGADQANDRYTIWHDETKETRAASAQEIKNLVHGGHEEAFQQRRVRLAGQAQAATSVYVSGRKTPGQKRTVERRIAEAEEAGIRKDFLDKLRAQITEQKQPRVRKFDAKVLQHEKDYPLAGRAKAYNKRHAQLMDLIESGVQRIRKANEEFKPKREAADAAQDFEARSKVFREHNERLDVISKELAEFLKMDLDKIYDPPSQYRESVWKIEPFDVAMAEHAAYVLKAEESALDLPRPEVVQSIQRIRARVRELYATGYVTSPMFAEINEQLMKVRTLGGLQAFWTWTANQHKKIQRKGSEAYSKVFGGWMTLDAYRYAQRLEFHDDEPVWQANEKLKEQNGNVLDAVNKELGDAVDVSLREHPAVAGLRKSLEDEPAVWKLRESVNALVRDTIGLRRVHIEVQDPKKVLVGRATEPRYFARERTTIEDWEFGEGRVKKEVEQSPGGAVERVDKALKDAYLTTANTILNGFEDLAVALDIPLEKLAQSKTLSLRYFLSLAPETGGASYRGTPWKRGEHRTYGNDVPDYKFVSEGQAGTLTVNGLLGTSTLAHEFGHFIDNIVSNETKGLYGRSVTYGYMRTFNKEMFDKEVTEEEEGKRRNEAETKQRLADLEANVAAGEEVPDWQLSGARDSVLSAEANSKVPSFGKKNQEALKESHPDLYELLHRIVEDGHAKRFNEYDEKRTAEAQTDDLMKMVKEFSSGNAKNDWYYSGGEEVWARTFEQYIHHKLREKGRVNPLLTQFSYDAAASEVYGGKAVYYPDDYMRDVIAPLMDKVIQRFKDDGSLEKAFAAMCGLRKSQSALLVPRTGFVLSKAQNQPLAGIGAAYPQPSAKGAPVGTIHTWSDGKQYKKVDEGTWEPVEEAQRPQWKAPPEQQRLVTVPPTKPNAQQLAKQKEQKAAQVEAEKEARRKLPLHEAYPAGTTIDLGPFGWLHVAGTTGATQRVSVTIVGTDTERDLSASEMETIIELSKSLSYRSVVDGVSALAHFRAVAAATSHRHPLSPVAAGNLRLDHAFPGMSDSRRLLLRSTLRSLYLFTGANVATVRDPELYNARLAEITGDKRFYIGLYSTVFQPSKQDYEQAHALFKALADKQPPDEAAGTEWYRGMNLDRYLVKDLEEGVYFKLHDISSFTANDTKAKSFANTGEHAPVVFVLTNPRRGAYINGASQYPDEDEILSGGHVRIVSVEQGEEEPDREDLYFQFSQDWEPSDSDDQAWQETLDEHKNSAYEGWQQDEEERQRNAYMEDNDDSDEGFEFEDVYDGNVDEWADSDDSTFDESAYDDERADFMNDRESDAFDDWYRDEYERPAGVTTVYVEHIADEDLPYGARVLGG